ncbi:MAG: hypothetical protein ACRD1E_10165, partial [Terriglobales bacterium]
MGLTRRLWSTLFGRGRVDRDLRREMEFHREMRAATPRPPTSGQRPRPFGNDLLQRERARERDLVRWLDDSLRDLAVALRGLRRAPGFACVAILTLALGIGATAAIFTVVDAVALRPLPYDHPEQLVSLLETSRQFPQMSLSWPDYLAFRDRSQAFSELAAVRGSDMILAHAGTPAMVLG